MRHSAIVQFRRRNTELAVGKIQLWEHVAIIIWLEGVQLWEHVAIWLEGSTAVGTCSYMAGGQYSCGNM